MSMMPREHSVSDQYLLDCVAEATGVRPDAQGSALGHTRMIIDFNALGRIVEKAILEARQEMLEAMQNVPVWGLP